jgi:pyrroline-5-carboxylate reductase
MTAPILMIGAGRMGGAMLDGWRVACAFDPTAVILIDPHPGEAARAAEAAGAALNPDTTAYAAARTVLLAVKPQLWREAAAAASPYLSPDAVIVSIAAGVRSADLAAAFDGRLVARVMPTTAVGIRQGVATVFSAASDARAAAHALFDPVATVVEVEDEALIDAATAVSGSAPAYLYAFVEALEAAGEAVGLPRRQAETLARATLIGAAALMAQSGETPQALRRQVTSPGGTTAAALQVLTGDGALQALMQTAVIAALDRARQLAG